MIFKIKLFYKFYSRESEIVIEVALFISTVRMSCQNVIKTTFIHQKMKANISQSIKFFIPCNSFQCNSNAIKILRKQKNCIIKAACTLIDSLTLSCFPCNFYIFSSLSNSLYIYAYLILEYFSVYVSIFSLFVRKLSKCSQVKIRILLYITNSSADLHAT